MRSQICAALAEFEGDLIRDRTMAGSRSRAGRAHYMANARRHRALSPLGDRIPGYPAHGHRPRPTTKSCGAFESSASMLRSDTSPAAMREALEELRSTLRESLDKSHNWTARDSTRISPRPRQAPPSRPERLLRVAPVAAPTDRHSQRLSGAGVSKLDGKNLHHTKHFGTISTISQTSEAF